jgi:hypothetical protein
MTTGYVSMRNEDGTQYLELVYGQLNWSEDFADRSVISKEVYDLVEAGVAASVVGDCPDNGFFGIYNLKFHQKGK